MNKIIFPFVLIALLVGGYFLYNNQIQENTNQTATTQTRNEDLLEERSTTSPIECTGTIIPELTEGPYYKSDSPENSNLYNEELPGEKIVLKGYVLDTNCQPITNAWLDFWQTDGNGEYDNEGYTLRGHQYTDENGMYTLTTVIPGEYPGRTPHIHVKVRAHEQSPIITTQLYIPGAERNTSDAIYNEALLMQLTDSDDGKQASYNFVVNN